MTAIGNRSRKCRKSSVPIALASSTELKRSLTCWDSSTCSEGDICGLVGGRDGYRRLRAGRIAAIEARIWPNRSGEFLRSTVVRIDHCAFFYMLPSWRGGAKNG